MFSDDEKLLSLDDACNIGYKVMEAADRVKVMHRMLPGAQACWGFTSDGVKFKVMIIVDEGETP